VVDFGRGGAHKPLPLNGLRDEFACPDTNRWPEARVAAKEPTGRQIISVHFSRIITKPLSQISVKRNNPRTRMSNYWDNVFANFRMRGAESRAVEAKMQAETNR
jgi:hypothetical protein